MWQLLKKTCGYSSLIPFAFNILTSAAAEYSREKNECVHPRHLALNKRSDVTVTRRAASVRVAV